MSRTLGGGGTEGQAGEEAEAHLGGWASILGRGIDWKMQHVLACQIHNHPLRGIPCWVYFCISDGNGYRVDGMIDSWVNESLRTMKIPVSTHSLRKGSWKEGKGLGVGIRRVTL